MDEFPWYVVAKSLLGEKEGSGSLDNQKIVELFRLVGHVEIKDDEVKRQGPCRLLSETR
jgi:hypothetical protein